MKIKKPVCILLCVVAVLLILTKARTYLLYESNAYAAAVDKAVLFLRSKYILLTATRYDTVEQACLHGCVETYAYPFGRYNVPHTPEPVSIAAGDVTFSYCKKCDGFVFAVKRADKKWVCFDMLGIKGEYGFAEGQFEGTKLVRSFFCDGKWYLFAFELLPGDEEKDHIPIDLLIDDSGQAHIPAIADAGDGQNYWVFYFFETEQKQNSIRFVSASDVPAARFPSDIKGKNRTDRKCSRRQKPLR